MAAKNEMLRQEALPWERGQFFAAYESVLGYYLVQSALEHRKPPSLLDVACGNGLLTNMMAPHFKRAVGIDASAAYVAKARQNYPHVEFVHTLAEEYETSECFSTITLISLLEHVLDPAALLKAVARHLAPSGILIAHVPNALAVNRKIAKLMGSLVDEYELSPFDTQVAGHRRSYDRRLLVKDFKAAGLKVIATGGVFYKMLSQAQLDWILEKGPWEEGGFGWGRVGAEEAKDWRKAFCDACYEFGKGRPEDCNLIYAVGQI